MKTKIHTALSVFALTGFVATTVPVHAGTNVNVNVGIPVPVVVAPQPVYIEQPPEMVFIPQSNVYFAFAPGVSVDLFFYDNRWWNRRGIGGTGAAITTGRGWPWGRGMSRPPSIECPWTTALSTSTRNTSRTASGRRATGNTAGTAISTVITTISGGLA